MQPVYHLESASLLIHNYYSLIVLLKFSGKILFSVNLFKACVKSSALVFTMLVQMSLFVVRVLCETFLPRNNQRHNFS